MTKNNSNIAYHSNPYTPLVHWVMRFYFLSPTRRVFKNELSRKQFEAVQSVMETIGESKAGILNVIVGQKPEHFDIQDSYIEERITARQMSEEEIARFYKLLYWVEREIAIKCNFICIEKEITYGGNNNEI